MDWLLNLFCFPLIASAYIYAIGLLVHNYRTPAYDKDRAGELLLSWVFNSAALLYVWVVPYPRLQAFACATVLNIATINLATSVLLLHFVYHRYKIERLSNYTLLVYYANSLVVNVLAYDSYFLLTGDAIMYAIVYESLLLFGCVFIPMMFCQRVFAREYAYCTLVILFNLVLVRALFYWVGAVVHAQAITVVVSCVGQVWCYSAFLNK